MAVDRCALEELLVEEYDDLLLGFANDGASRAERKVLPLDGIDVHHSVADPEVCHVCTTEIGPEPIRIQLLVHTSSPQDLYLLNTQLDGAVALLYFVLMLLQPLDELGVERVEAHLHVRQLADRQALRVLKQDLELRDALLLTILREAWVQVVEFVHCLALLALGVYGDAYFWELGAVLLDDVKAFLRVLPVLANVFGTASVLIVLELVVNGVCSLMSGHKAHELDDVHLLREVLDIQADVHDLALFLACLVVGDQV